MGEDAVFLVRDVSKRYRSRAVLENITCEVRRGEILGIVGPAGCGKTTFVHLLTGVLQPSGGDILFHAFTAKGVVECDVLRHRDVIARSYGIVGPVAAVYRELTVRENLEYFGVLYGIAKETIARNIELLLNLFELKHHAHIPAGHLSPATLRRADIACALVHNPAVLIMDDVPLEHDHVLLRQVHEVLKRLHLRGTTTIITSRHHDELDGLCSRIATIRNGHLHIDDPQKQSTPRRRELLFTSVPGDIAKVTKALANAGYEEVSCEGTMVAVKTDHVERLMGDMLTILKKLDERLTDIRIVKAEMRTVETLPPLRRDHSIVVPSSRHTKANQKSIAKSRAKSAAGHRGAT